MSADDNYNKNEDDEFDPDVDKIEPSMLSKPLSRFSVHLTTTLD